MKPLYITEEPVLDEINGLPFIKLIMEKSMMQFELGKVGNKMGEILSLGIYLA